MQSTDWEKIFANDVTNKGLVSKIYKQLMKLSIIKTSQSKNGQKTYISPKKMAKRHRKRCSALMITTEMKIKTTMR